MTNTFFTSDTHFLHEEEEHIFFTADTHFSHGNIIDYTNRPFKSAEHMNMELIRKWNERVKPEDTVYFLGDFNFKSNSGKGQGEPIKAKEIIKQLNGNIIFIKGNHDCKSNGVKTMIQAAVLEFGGMEVYAVHNPAQCHPIYKLNLCGHVHNLWKSQKRRGYTVINVGVDVNNFYPMSVSDILDEYYKLNPKKKQTKGL